jgi:uracil-DNA glycosylase
LNQPHLFGNEPPVDAKSSQLDVDQALTAAALAPPTDRLGDWAPLVSGFWHSAEGRALESFLSDRLAAGARIYPPQPWRALELTPLRQVRVVILGQDPYHGMGQAHGLAFSVPVGVRPPPSLRNIFKELVRSGVWQSLPLHGNLETWARQGVLLLNTSLTVEDGKPASHAKRGWEVLTDLLIETVARQSEPVVFLLWGVHAQAKQALIARAAGEAGGELADRHLVLAANHPSPLSAKRPPQPFIGCGHFELAANFLLKTRHPSNPWLG